MTQLLKTDNGEEHGLINSVSNSVKAEDAYKGMTPETKAKAEKLRKEESRLVNARYINHRGSNERLEKPYCRWAGDQIQSWKFIPEYTYEVPVGLINEVNASRLAQRSEVLDANGVPTKKDGKGVRIHEFVPVGF